MVNRYFKLLEFPDHEDDDIMYLLPSPACNKRLRSLLAELRDIESVAKALQGQDVDLLDVQQWFDELISANSEFAHYLGKFICLISYPDLNFAQVPEPTSSTAPLLSQCVYVCSAVSQTASREPKKLHCYPLQRPGQALILIMHRTFRLCSSSAFASCTDCS